MVDLGGYIIILTNDDGKIKLYGSPADNADTLEMSDEILEVNGRTLKNATHNEVIQYIHQCIKSRTICLRLRRSGNKMEELDGPNAGRIRDAWVIAVERSARERLQRLTALKKIQPRDIQAILRQQMNDAVASTSEDSTSKDVSSNQITVTLTDRDFGPNAFSTKPNNGTIPKELGIDAGIRLERLSISQERKDDLEELHSYEETKLLVPVQSGRIGERRTSSPFRNGRTEVLIGEPEGSPRSPRGSTSSATSDFLNPPDERNEPICRSRRRSGSGVTDISQQQQQQLQLQENNNSSSRDAKKPQEGLGPDEMWAPDALGHHRELPVDVPDTLLQKAYPNKADPNGVKPAIPPRDQKRAPARPPKDNLRFSTQNNNVETSDNANAEPTQQQLHSIRKYQEQLRKRKDEEERQEMLSRSLRGSKKLQALESHATSLSGQENSAYAQDEVTTGVSRVAYATPNAVQEVEEPLKLLTFNNILHALTQVLTKFRMEQCDRSDIPSISAHNAIVEKIQECMQQESFKTAILTSIKLKNIIRNRDSRLEYETDDASVLAEECADDFQEWQSTARNVSGETMANMEELANILLSNDMQALLLAHDSIAKNVDGYRKKPQQEPRPSSSSQTEDFQIDDNVKIIRIEKNNEPLGATVRNEGDAIIIGRIVYGGVAQKSGLLREGDEVLEVNGIEMRGKSINEVCDILAGMQCDILTFLVHPVSPRPKRRTQIQTYVRAHFDYDPEEDPYLPCKDLGMSFQKGEILRVIMSEEDPNWWQAYREGEQEILASLIPSKAFQHLRESQKKKMPVDESTAGSSKFSTLFCTKTNQRKKNKNKTKLGTNFNDDGYSVYASTSKNDHDLDNMEIRTYEEVALYYPRDDYKRPIVLIGPPNIGRHDIRRKLMQDRDRFAAAVPHTSRPKMECEVDGVDYHFISQRQFEADILCRKFVEHGEYQKAYYGTSMKAIKTVIDSGRICILNLHPESLKTLRNSDLKPYIVFIAPPSLERLKHMRILKNEKYKEDDLKDLIEKGREMDDKFGHLFDVIIINNDTNRTCLQLLAEINSMEREPQWVPISWV